MHTKYVPEVWFDGVAEGRSHLGDLLDASARGVPAGLRRDDARFAIIDAARLRRLFAGRSSHAEVVAEADGWSIFLPGIPVAAGGEILPEATAEMVDALRDYAADWIDRLHVAPNHAENWWLVHLVELSSDDELADWLTAGQSAPQS
jgi:hypothetical protein